MIRARRAVRSSLNSLPEAAAADISTAKTDSAYFLMESECTPAAALPRPAKLRPSVAVLTGSSSILETLVFMAETASSRIETGVIEVLKSVSRRPIEPTLSSDLVADLGFDSLQVLELVAELEDTLRHLDPPERRAGDADRRADRRPGRGSRRRAPQHVMPTSANAAGSARRRCRQRGRLHVHRRRRDADSGRTRRFASPLIAWPADCSRPACSAAMSSPSSSATPNSS